MAKASDDKIFDFRPIGKTIREAREVRGWSRAQMAEKIGVTEGYLSSIENKGQNPGFYLFFSLVLILGLDSHALLQTAMSKKLPVKSSIRRELDLIMDAKTDEDLLFFKAFILAYESCETAKLKKRESDL